MAAALWSHACVSIAGPSVYWHFDDALPPCAVTTLVSEAGSSGMTAKLHSGAPQFSSEIFPSPTRQISHGNGGAVVNPVNRSSVFFDGKSQLTAAGTLRPEAFTVEAFIKVNAHHDYPLLIGKIRDGSRNSASWSLSISGRKIRTRFDTYPEGPVWPPSKGFNQSFSSGIDVEDGAWHHVAFSYSNQSVQMYVDYLPCGDLNRTAFPIVYSDEPICIGAGAGEGPFNGWMDEVRITPKVLTPEEFLYAMPFGDLVRNEWRLQCGTNAVMAAAAWSEWVRTERILRRQANASQPGVTSHCARLSALKKQLDTITEKTAESLFFDIRALKREAMLSDAQINFTSILCIDNPYVQGSEAYHEIRHRTENCATYGGGLLVLDGLGPDAAVRRLAPQEDTPAAFWRPDLSFDGSKVLYCMKLTNEPAYHLYETGIDGSGTRQITKGDYNDLDPIYTPDGNIVFSTSRCNQFLRCGDSKFRMFILARCNMEGKEIYFISANNEADFTPALLPDGRILYTRWEYVDKEVNRIQSLWTVNPDGTGASAYWGNQSYWPDMLLNARPIPDTQQVLFQAPGHHNCYDGPLGVVNQSEGMNYPDGVYNLTPHIPWAEVGQGPDDQAYNEDFSAPTCYRAFQTPFPVSKDLFLVSARTGLNNVLSRDTAPGLFKLYLMDYDGNMELLYTGEHNILHARPIRARKKPAIIPSSVRWPGKMLTAEQQAESGTVYSSDIYEGTSIPRGLVKSLRILEIGSTTFGDCAGYRSTVRETEPYRQKGALPTPTWQVPGSPAISFVYDEGVKRVLGTVPVEEDGSVHFNLPPIRSVFFQLLDEQGRCLQTMRSFTHVMSGEVRGCVGCHETPSVAPPPPSKVAIAMRRKPSELTPPAWGDASISFPRFVQPVLDKHCISCHSGEKPKAGMDLSHRIEAGSQVSWPYVLLVFGKNPKSVADFPQSSIAGPIFPYCIYPNPQWKVSTQDTVVPPMTAMSYRSKLIQIATSGKHHKVKVSADEEAKLVAWVDALCPYLGMEELALRPDIPPDVYYAQSMYKNLTYPARMHTAPVVHKAFCQDQFESQDARLPKDAAGNVLPSIWFKEGKRLYRIP